MSQNEFLERTFKAMAAELGPNALNKGHADIVVRHVFAQIADALNRGDTFQRDGSGTFQFIKPYPAQSGQISDIPASAVINFSPDSVLAELVPEAVQGLAELVAKAVAQELEKRKEG